MTGLPADASPTPAARSRDWAGWIMALTAAFSFSFAAPIARGAITAGFDPTTLVMARMVLATVLVGATVAAMQRGVLAIDRRGLGVALAAGLLNGLGMLLFFWALALVDASVASMMISLIPLGVLTLLALRGEQFTYRHIVRLGLGLGGVYLLIGPGGDVNLAGIALLAVAIVCFSLHMALLQWFLRPYEALTVTFYVSAAMAVVVTVAWLIQGAPWENPGPAGWLAVGGLVLVSTYLSRLLMVSAINRIGSGQMALLSPLETLLTIIWAMLFLGERLSLLQWAGGLLVLASALLAIQRLGRARWRPRWRIWTRV